VLLAGASYDVVLSGARIDGTLDADGDFKLERLMAAARPLGSRAAPAQSLSAPAAATGARTAARWLCTLSHPLSARLLDYGVTDSQHAAPTSWSSTLPPSLPLKPVPIRITSKSTSFLRSLSSTAAVPSWSQCSD
jgi:hypothetical protein